MVDEPGQPRIVAFVGRRIRSRVSAIGTTTDADSADALAARPDPALARRFGVDGFCYPCRLVAGSAVFGGGTTGPGPTPGPGLFPFLLCWEVDQGVPTGVEAADAERDGHDVALVDLFAHREYIRRGERPVVVVLEHDDADGGRSTVATWRRRWHASGAPDPFLVALDHRSDPGGDSAATPYDAVINVPRSAVHDGPESTGASDDSGPAHAPVPIRFPFIEVAERVGRPGGAATGAPADAPERYRQRLASALSASGPDDLVFVNDWDRLAARASVERSGGLGYLDATAIGRCPPVLDDAGRIEAGILHNRTQFRRLEGLSVECLAAGDAETTLRIVAAASEFAWYNHTGIYASMVFEGALRDVGRRLVADLPVWRRVASGRRRVLHVLTEAHAVGGHTRMAWRWMAWDESSDHAVLLTGQAGRPVPPPLAEAATAGVTHLHALSAEDKVSEACLAMAEFDLVVLHIHPFDAVTVAACSDPDRRPPTLLVDHADHVYWLGVGAADALGSMRPAGREVAVGRRGVDAARVCRLPSPVAMVERTTTRDQAAASLGMAPEAVVLLTLSSAYKYAPMVHPAFPDLVELVLAAVPQAHLFAVGGVHGAMPGWDRLLATFAGRVHLTGSVPDPHRYLEAADVYLEPFPFASTTSLLEAVLTGTPAVAYQSPASVGPVASDDFELVPLRVSSPEQWVQTVVGLAGDPGERHRLGAEMARAAARAHLPDGWRDYLDDAYRSVVHGAAAVPGAHTESCTVLDLSVYAVHLLGSMTTDLDQLLARHGLSEHVVGPARAVALGVVLMVVGGARSAIASIQAVLEACNDRAIPELVVVDCDTTGATSAMLQTFGDRVHVIRVGVAETPPGPLWREAVAATGADRVLLLSDHVQLQGRGLERLLESAGERGEHGPVGFVGSPEVAGPICLLYHQTHLSGHPWPVARYLPADE